MIFRGILGVRRRPTMPRTYVRWFRGSYKIGQRPMVSDDFLGPDGHFEIWSRLLPDAIVVQCQIIGKHRARGNLRILVQPRIGFLGCDCLRPSEGMGCFPKIQSRGLIILKFLCFITFISFLLTSFLTIFLGGPFISPFTS